MPNYSLGTAQGAISIKYDGKALSQADADISKIKKSSDGLATKLGSVGKSMTTTGKKMTLGVTAPLLAVGALAVKAADDVGAAYDSIKIATGATGDGLKDLQGVFDNIAKDAPESMDQISKAIGVLNTATGATGPTLESLTKNVLEASRVMGEDGAGNAVLLGKALNQWGVPAEKGVDILKTMYVAGQKFGTSLSDQMTNLNAYGPILSNAGFTMEDSIALFGQMDKAGLKVSRLMPGLNMAFRKWAQAGKDPQKMLAETIDKMKKAKTSGEALTIATDQFGSQGAQRLTTAVRTSGISFENLSSQLSTAGVDLLDVGKNTRTMSEDMAATKNNASLALAKLGEIILPMVVKGLNAIIAPIQKAANWFGTLSDGTKKFILAAGGILAAVGPLLLVFGKLTSGIGSIIGISGKLIKAIKGANLAFLSMPIFWVIAGIVALGVAIYEVIQHWDEIKKVIIIVWDAIKAATQVALDAIIAAWDAIVSAFTTALDAVTGVVTAGWDAITGAFTTAIDAIVGLVTTVWTSITDAFTAGIDAVIAVVTAIWGGIKDYIVQPVVDAWNAVTGAFQAAYDFVAGIIQNILDWIGEHWKILIAIILGPLGIIIDIVVTHWTSIKNFIVKVVTAISDFLTMIWNAISKAIMAVITPLVGAIKAAWDFLKSIIQTVMDAIKSVFMTVWNAVKDFILGVVDDIKNRAINTFNKFKDAILAVWDAVKSAAAAAWNWVKDKVVGIATAIKSVVMPIINAIKSGVETAWNAVKSVTSTVWEGIKSVVTTIATGIQTAITTAFNAVKGVAETVWHAIESVISTVYHSTIEPIIDGIKTAIDAVKSALQWLKSTWDSIWGGISGTISRVWNGTLGKVLGAIKGVLDTIAGVVKKVSDAIGAVGHGISNAVGAVGSFLGFDTGGWVPGPKGRLASNVRVHGGEYVVSDDMLAGRSRIDQRVLAAIGRNQERSARTRMTSPPTQRPGATEASSQGTAGHVTTGPIGVRVFIGDEEIKNNIRVVVGDTLAPLTQMVNAGGI